MRPLSGAAIVRPAIEFEDSYQGGGLPVTLRLVQPCQASPKIPKASSISRKPCTDASTVRNNRMP